MKKGVRLILGLIILFFSLPTFGQEKVFTIKGIDVTIKEIFEQIESQCEYKIAYNATKFNAVKKITINIKDKPLQEIMNVVLKDTGCKYKINGKHIVISQNDTKSEKTTSGQMTHIIRGKVTDDSSGEPLINVSVFVNNTTIGSVTDIDGMFVIKDVPIGRFDLIVSYIGYETIIIKEQLLTSAKEGYCEILMREKTTGLEEVIVRPKINKSEPVNKLASVSSRLLSIEESSRYAGAFDDPARMVSSFAGVAGDVSSNAIVVRGNSPQYLQWKLDGVEIPNPTHFPDITGVGGGILTALSSMVLGNSDFLTGAFPAQYTNALAGVFDMSLREGNRWKRERTFQFGTLGIDIALEGPFKKGGKSSYLINYRYSTMALLADLVPDLIQDAAGMRYQDLSFKFNFPTNKMGTFSLWGIGVKDLYSEEREDGKWENIFDAYDNKFTNDMYAAGIGHKILLGNSAYLKTSVANTYSKATTKVFSTGSPETLKIAEKWGCTILPEVCNMKGNNSTLVFNTYLNKKFSARHSNRTGISVTEYFYDLDYLISPDLNTLIDPVEQFAKSNGHTTLFSAFTNSTIALSNTITANIGVSGHLFRLNKNYKVEPRVGLKWRFTPGQTLGVGYGLHSRIEKIDYYFVEKDGVLVNKDLKPTSAHHYVMSYDLDISENLHLKIEPYYQKLKDLPVSPEGPFSIINQERWYIDQQLVNSGEGRNYGVELTLERYLNRGFYYLLSGSLFNSEYMAADKIWRNTPLNRSYIANLLFGKEWRIRSNNIFGLNMRLTYQGGKRYTPVLEDISIEQKDVILDEENAFSKKYPDVFIGSFTVSYKINKEKSSHEFAFKMVNFTGQKENHGPVYNYLTNSIDNQGSAIVMPNVSYKICF